MTPARTRLAACALLAVVLTACGQQGAAALPHAASSPLASVVIQPQAAHAEQVWDGVVEAVHRTTITAQTNARVLELPHDVNDVVARGDVLVRFSDVEQKSARGAAQAEVAAAQAAQREAAATYARMEAVYAKGFVSTAQRDAARARRDATQAAFVAARAQRDQVGQALDYTVLRAPFAGIVTRRLVQVGEAVQAGPPSPQPLIELQSLDQLRVSVEVPQAAAEAIRRFHAAQVLGDGTHRITASDVSVFPYADPHTHSFNVRVTLPAGTAGLYPGMMVKVAFTGDAVSRLLLPASALVQRGELIGVYVLDGPSVSLRQVRVGHRLGDDVEVLAGLAKGERIAVDPSAAARWLVEQRRGARR